jgi:hypothetical protein
MSTNASREMPKGMECPPAPPAPPPKKNTVNVIICNSSKCTLGICRGCQKS